MAADEKDRDVLPTWDGTLSKFDDYVIDTKAYVRGTRREDRYVCGPRLWRKLTGRARQAVRDIDWDSLEQVDGHEYLIGQLRSKLGAQSVHDAGKYLGKWVFEMQRKASEPMTAYISRDDAAYEDVVKAFSTEYFRRARREHLPGWQSEWRSVLRQLIATVRNMANPDEGNATVNGTGEGDAPPPAAARATAAENAQEALDRLLQRHVFLDPEHADFGLEPGILPLKQLRGWLLLSRSRLNNTERASVVAALRGNFDLQAIQEQLRLTWPDDDLAERDGRGIRAHAAVSERPVPADEEDDVSVLSLDAEIQDHDDDEEDRESEGAESLLAEETEAEECYKVQLRSFEEAKDQLARARRARRYFQGGGAPRDKPKGDGKPETKRPFARRADQRKGTPAPVRKRPPWNSSGGPARGPCLRCGKPHDTKECPKAALERSAGSGHRTGFGGFILTMTQPDSGAARPADFGVLEAAARGYAILDVGASSSVSGMGAAYEFVCRLAELGHHIRMDTGQKQTFVFGNGESLQCTGMATFPIAIGNQPCQLRVNIIDATAPLLLGVDALTKLGGIIDCRRGELVCESLGIRDSLVRLRSGHLALQILPPKRLDPTE